MPLTDFDAPRSGGYAPGGRIFAVDGDWTIALPEGPPEIHYPFAGDSMVSLADVVQRVDVDPSEDHPLGFYYQAFPVGNRQNLQPFSANQQAIVIDQKFRIGSECYQPMRLNTRYDPAWALPWQGSFPDGLQLSALQDAILVHDGEIKDLGGGLVEFTRIFATIPPTRNETEQYTISRIGFLMGGTEFSRPPITVMSRIQCDYFVWDPVNLLPEIPLFTDATAAGVRLNNETGMRPKGFLIDAMKFCGASEHHEVNAIYDISASSPTASMPSLADYESWLPNGNGTSNGLVAEMCIDASTFTRHMGNIWSRTTRFAEVQ